MDDIICLFCKHRQPLSGGCKAFRDGIPFEFSSGEKEHREKVEGQTGDYVFEQLYVGKKWFIFQQCHK